MNHNHMNSLDYHTYSGGKDSIIGNRCASNHRTVQFYDLTDLKRINMVSPEYSKLEA